MIELTPAERETIILTSEADETARVSGVFADWMGNMYAGEIRAIFLGSYYLDLEGK